MEHRNGSAYYEAVAEIYPMEMRSNTYRLSTTTPCYRVKRLSTTDDFKASVCEHCNINATEYGNHIFCYETTTHTLILKAHLRDSLLALSTVDKMLKLIDTDFWKLLSVQIEQSSNYREAPIKDYHWDSIPHAVSEDTVGAPFMCYDTIQSPHITQTPQPLHWIKALLLSLVFATVVCGSIAFLIEKLKKTDS